MSDNSHREVKDITPNNLPLAQKQTLRGRWQLLANPALQNLSEAMA